MGEFLTLEFGHMMIAKTDSWRKYEYALSTTKDIFSIEALFYVEFLV